MLSKELIEKACNLTCSKDDMIIDQSEMQFDIDHPFKKYYDVNIILLKPSKSMNVENGMM